FALYAEAPLLHVRPDDLAAGDRGDVQRKCSRVGRATHTTRTDATPAERIILRHIENAVGARAAFERTGVRFITRAVFKEKTVPGADGRPAGPGGIPCDTNSRRGIEGLVGHATGWNAVDAALLNAVGNVRIKVCEVQRDWSAGRSKNERAGIGRHS